MCQGNRKLKIMFWEKVRTISSTHMLLPGALLVASFCWKVSLCPKDGSPTTAASHADEHRVWNLRFEPDPFLSSVKHQLSELPSFEGCVSSCWGGLAEGPLWESRSTARDPPFLRNGWVNCSSSSRGSDVTSHYLCKLTSSDIRALLQLGALRL